MTVDQLKVCHIHHIGEKEEEDCRIAISPNCVKMIASRSVIHRDRDLLMINIFFVDGEVDTFRISNFELMTLEKVVAGYSDELY